jgi:hypothetical protein
MRRSSPTGRVQGALIVALGMYLGGCGATGSGSVEPSPSVSASGSPFGVSSTLHGLTELPHRIHWQAMPSGRTAASEVDFLIDDQLAWVEHNPPYFYADDGNWLVTSFLERGAHTFAAKAIGAAEQSGSESVSATVKAAPDPPANLAGGWSRTVTGDNPGVWHVTINAIGWLFDDPHGGGQNQDAEYPAAGKVEIHGAIIEPPYPAYDRGGAFCGDPFDPDGTFSYSVSADGSQLTLTADAPVCYQDLIEGSWARDP